MQKIKAVIIEDEERSRMVSKFVGNICPEVDVVGSEIQSLRIKTVRTIYRMPFLDVQI